jgi:hypothetical protein
MEPFSKVGRLLKKQPKPCAGFAALHLNDKKREKLQEVVQN